MFKNVQEFKREGREKEEEGCWKIHSAKLSLKREIRSLKRDCYIGNSLLSEKRALKRKIQKDILAAERKISRSSEKTLRQQPIKAQLDAQAKTNRCILAAERNFSRSSENV